VGSFFAPKYDPSNGGIHQENQSDNPTFGGVKVGRDFTRIFSCELLRPHLGCGFAPATQFSEAGLPTVDDRFGELMRVGRVLLAGALGQDPATVWMFFIGEVMPEGARHVDPGVPNAPLLLHERIARAARHFGLPIRLALRGNLRRNTEQIESRGNGKTLKSFVSVAGAPR